MSTYHCKHCGATAISKCSRSRTVFPDDGFDAMLSHVLKYNIQMDLTRRTAQVVLTVSVPFDGNKSDREMIEHALFLVSDLTPEQIQNYACNHNWVISEGTCMFGCCVAETTELGVPQLDGRN